MRAVLTIELCLKYTMSFELFGTAKMYAMYTLYLLYRPSNLDETAERSSAFEEISST